MTGPSAPVAGAWLLVAWAVVAAAGSARAAARPPRLPHRPGDRPAAGRPVRPGTGGPGGAELPELVEALAAGIGAGRSPAECVDDAAASAPAAERAALDDLARALRRGAGTAAAFDAWAAASPRPGAGLVAAAVGMAAGSGGEVHRALGGVAATLREHRAVEREVRALGAQARLSATVLAVAPIGVVAIGAVVDADLARFLLGTPAGRSCLAAGLLLDLTSWRWMRRLAASVGARGRPGDPAATLPELVDLLAVAAGVGLPVAGALAAAAPRSPDPWAAELGRCLAAAEAGALLADALGDLGRTVGPVAGPLVAVLTESLADGDRLVPGLARVAADARDRRRRSAEERARQLPVRMLAPLVCCSLPAFVLVALVPLLAGALAGLDTTTP